MFKERLARASVKQPTVNMSINEELPPAPSSGASSCGLPSGDRLLMTLVRQDTGWIDEIKNYLQGQVLPEEDAEAERVARQAKSYSLHDGDLYRKRPNGVALRCIPAEEGRQLIKGHPQRRVRPPFILAHPRRQGLPEWFLLAQIGRAHV